MELTRKYELKTYNANECCIFRKTKEIFGGLSNMASGFPLKVNSIYILSAEALYQACRFPHFPDLQEKIILEKSPMSAKMVGKPFRTNSRPDWDEKRIIIMRWVLKVKLAQNFIEFGKLLESTFNKPIVEDSSKDDFWGAIRNRYDENILKGTNALGRLLMDLRKFYNENRYSYEMFVVEPLDIPDFKLYGRLIETIDEREKFILDIKNSTRFIEIEEYKSWKHLDDDSKVAEKTQSFIKESEQPNKKLKKDNKKNKQTKTRKKKIKNKVQGQTIQNTLPFIKG